MTKLSSMCSIAFGIAVLSAPSLASAGEVTGGPNPKFTPVNSYRAKSICSFSGQEDGLALIGFVNGVPQFEVVDTGPGLVQTPHQENSAGIIHEPGIPGDACRGNLPSE
ncbi:MAG: hypothetical protein QOF05_335 [Sphingomonadales bacterium]|jgi:hypothetical protein|nr:hypothetical protein [Sphingomonadales bacterium]